MAVKFRMEPKGDVDIGKEGRQFTRRMNHFGQPAKDVNKTVFSEEAVRKFSGKGHWFEIRVDECQTANMCMMGIGFTATDPETWLQIPLPARAHAIPKTWVLGYARSAHWDGERIEIENMFAAVKPFQIFTVGVLATPSGSMEVYIDRKKIFTFDPTEKGLPPIPTDEPLFAVVDCVGALKKAEACHDSLPPDGSE